MAGCTAAIAYVPVTGTHALRRRLRMLSSLAFDLPLPALVLLLAALAIAGLVSGLSGFGFSAIGAVTLILLPPSEGVPLLMALSTANQLLSVSQLRTEMPALSEWWADGPAPYLLGGVIGLPCGVWLLGHLLPTALMTLFGTLLLTYAVFSLFRPTRWRAAPGGWLTRSLVGIGGGVIGGCTAFPGAAVVVWLNLVGTPKVAARATTQPYILGMQVLGLALLALSRPESFGPQFRGLFALCLPVVLPCTWAGVALYRRMSDYNFRQVTLTLLAVAGIGLVGKAWVA
jgi:uncharacterized membrane protein YfcA